MCDPGTRVHTRPRATRTQGGFTLIELIVVVVIIGVLASIAFFAIRGVRESGVSVACRENAVTLMKALESYKIRTGSYPNGRVSGQSVTSADVDVLVSEGYLRQNILRASPDYTLSARIASGGASVSGTYAKPSGTKPCQAP